MKVKVSHTLIFNLYLGDNFLVKGKNFPDMSDSPINTRDKKYRDINLADFFHLSHTYSVIN